MRFLLTIFLFFTALTAVEDWSHDYTQALKNAKKEKKLVYMLITSEECRWCRKFESTTLEDEEVLQRLKQKYVLLHIDRDKDYMPEYFKKERVPRHYFITQKGEIIHSFLGYWSSEDFHSFLDDVQKKYKKSSQFKQ